MHEGDALFLAGHLLLTYLPHIDQAVSVVGSLHTLPSLLVHEGDASFLVGHLLFASVVSP